jgi:high-affinity nickel-transport protein
MVLITAAIAVPVAYTANRFNRFYHGLSLASGFVSVGFGLLLIYQIGFVQGLFSP